MSPIVISSSPISDPKGLPVRQLISLKVPNSIGTFLTTGESMAKLKDEASGSDSKDLLPSRNARNSVQPAAPKCTPAVNMAPAKSRKRKSSCPNHQLLPPRRQTRAVSKKRKMDDYILDDDDILGFERMIFNV